MEYDHEQGGDKDPSGAPGPGGFRPRMVSDKVKHVLSNELY